MIPLEVLAALKAALGRQWVKDARAELDAYATDGLPTHGYTPGAVVPRYLELFERLAG